MNSGSIIGTAIFAQVCLLVIVWIAAILIKFYEPRRYSAVEESVTLSIFSSSLLMLIMLILLFITDGYIPIWSPVMKSFSFVGLNWSKVLLWVWIVDILLVSYFVRRTGGSKESPYTTLLFVFPPIAMLLHESLSRVSIYTALVVIFFSLLLTEGKEKSTSAQPAFWWVSVASFLLTTSVSYMTRS